MLNKKALAGTPSTPAVFVEDVFSTYLYTGNGSTQTITNGIDLSGKGGLVWVKTRTTNTGGGTYNNSHILADSARTPSNILRTNGDEAQDGSPSFSSFNSNGFTLGTSANTNNTGVNSVSWTFRKQAKFFDVVTYTGNGANRTIAHNLGSVPGSIWVKRTDTTGAWQCYHRSLANTEYLVLNTTAAKATGATRWNSTTPTSTEFSLGTDSTVNANGGTYVAYLFAHDAGGFGTAGTDNVISCGSYTGTGSPVTVTLGYEIQWLLVKRTDDGTNAWVLMDTMRGLAITETFMLFPNSTSAETSGVQCNPTATGFQITSTGSNLNNPGSTYIYIAIRRGPMKTPTSGTSVYNAIARTGTGAAATVTGVGFAPDFVGAFKRGGGVFGSFFDKLRGAALLQTGSTNGESAAPNEITAYGMDGVSLGTSGGQINYDTFTYINWFFRRSPGFMDVVCYTGTGSNTTFSHNLGVVPELMIVKRRSTSNAWGVYAGDNTDYLVLNTTAATADDNTYWNDTSPTSSVFSVGTNNAVNASGDTYVAYLFATLAGVSKVGSYTGTAAAQTINCSFTAGARFVLIKRTDSTGDWFVWDTTRNIISGDDPYLLLNSTAAEVTNTDYIDPVNSGFELSSTAPAAINANGGSFIFMAIA